MAKPKLRSQSKKKNDILGVNKSVLFLLGVPLFFWFLSTFVLLFFAMLPTFGAMITERGPHRYAWICVGGLNFSGVAPYLIKLWFTGQDITDVFKILGDVWALVLIYGTAAFGWILYASIPHAVGMFMSMTSGRQVA
ncbi:MAG: acyl-CoA synthetase, partial [Alphaproteobacteria bacterium]|nr:acyl-CoA synthetase [Alphaproteobacteria bacterium]